MLQQKFTVLVTTLPDLTVLGYRTNTTESSVATSVADPDPGSGAFLTPG
jgi:hypothetical protein